MVRCVEVSLVRWSQAEGSGIADTDLAAHLDDFWSNGLMLRSASSEPLSTTTIFAPPQLSGLMEEQSKAWPLAAPLGLDRLGYLQHDLYPGRLFLPTLPGTDVAELTPCNERLEVNVDEQVIADLCYWNAGWGPRDPCSLVVIAVPRSFHEARVIGKELFRRRVPCARSIFGK